VLSFPHAVTVSTFLEVLPEISSVERLDKPGKTWYALNISGIYCKNIISLTTSQVKRLPIVIAAAIVS
jgi:hypothetical protein